MSRLIDADELTEKAWRYGLATREDIAQMIANAPTVDAVEVVRCKDCKWWGEDDNDLYGYCMAMKHGYVSSNWEIGIYRKYKGDFYCADGERKDEAEDE